LALLKILARHERKLAKGNIGTKLSSSGLQWPRKWAKQLLRTWKLISRSADGGLTVGELVLRGK